MYIKYFLNDDVNQNVYVYYQLIRTPAVKWTLLLIWKGRRRD